MSNCDVVPKEYLEQGHFFNDYINTSSRTTNFAVQKRNELLP